MSKLNLNNSIVVDHKHSKINKNKTDKKKEINKNEWNNNERNNESGWSIGHVTRWCPC